MADDYMKKLWEIGPALTEAMPHSKRLGIRFVAIDKGRGTLSLPYNPELIGDPQTRVVHGGAVSALLDQACGLAALAGFKEPVSCATLNFSIDYMRAAVPGETIIATAECYKATKHIAFLRAVAYDVDEEDPIAVCQATYIATRIGSANGEMVAALEKEKS